MLLCVCVCVEPVLSCESVKCFINTLLFSALCVVPLHDSCTVLYIALCSTIHYVPLLSCMFALCLCNVILSSQCGAEQCLHVCAVILSD